MTRQRREGGRPDRKVVSAVPGLAARAALARSARRRRIGFRLGIGVAVLAPLALLGWLVLSTPVLSVRSVAVTGTERLTPAQVRGAADVVAGTPLARIDTGDVVRRIRALSGVAEVEVTRGWPSTLKVRVVERTAVVGLVSASGVTLVDAKGVAFAPAPRLPPGLVRLQVARPGPKDPATLAALAVLAELPPELRGPLRIVRAASPASVTLVLSGGRQVLWGGTGDTALKVQAAQALLKLPGSFFDVSRPTVVTRR